jgi:hypothetical protein
MWQHPEFSNSAMFETQKALRNLVVVKKFFDTFIKKIPTLHLVIIHNSASFHCTDLIFQVSSSFPRESYSLHYIRHPHAF